LDPADSHPRRARVRQLATRTFAPLLALGLAGVLLGSEAFVAPASSAHSTIGGSLGLGQRDVRVHLNFSGAGANLNQQVDPSFPGYAGAARALWKATLEWGSELHGAGEGDAHQPGGLGSGGANFDPSWQGLALGVSGTNDNVMSEIGTDGAGVLAYCESPIADGWRIRFHANVNWSDAPGVSLSAGAIDLQGVACHEYGHALGLGHSSANAATMAPSAFGSCVWMRSIESDDRAGLAAIYGAKSAAKPRITSVSVHAGEVRVEGSGFAASGNALWFTQASAGGTGAPVALANLVSSAQGTRIAAPIPAAAGAGDLLVKVPGTGHAALSNAWPFDPVPPAPPAAPQIAWIAPAEIACLAPEPRRVRVGASGLASLQAVWIAGVPLSSTSWHALSSNELELELPLLSALGPAALVLHGAGGASAPAALEITACEPPVLALGAAGLSGSAPTPLRFGGEPGEIALLLVSGELGPSALPGVLQASIGNHFASLYSLGTCLVPASGWAQRNYAFGGLPLGVQLHFQAGFVSGATLALPLAMSNVCSATVLP